VPPYQHAPAAQQPTQIPQQPVQYQSYTASEKTPFYKKKAFLIAAGVLLLMGLISMLMEKEEAPIPEKEHRGVAYKVIKEENLDHANAKRSAYHIEVPQGTADKEIDETLKTAVADLKKKRDVDALSVFLYFADTEMAYAKATWAPDGKWEKADQVANRDSFQISIERLSGSKPAAKDAGERFGLDTATRKQVYKQIVAAERKATAESEAKYPADLDKQLDLQRQLQEQYKKALADRHKLTREQLDKIGTEGVTGNWPMD
jgi:hypothetical protein